MQLTIKISLKYSFSKRKIDLLIFVKSLRKTSKIKIKNRETHVNDICAPV